MTGLAIDPDFCAALFAELLGFSQHAPGVTRAAYGAGEERAHALMRATGLALGLTAETDAAGNLFLTMAGRDPTLAPWMVGSHVDTVPHGGNFDGAAGVIGGLAAVEALRRAGLVPARPVTVAVFRAEESVWFPASYVGSRAAFGLLPPEVLDLPRADTGRSLRDHMADLGLRPEAVARGERLLDPARIHGFVEMHIEQGPALEAAGSPVGFVTAISGSFRYRKAACFGRYGHSGAVARSARSDAVFALADLITGLDALWGTLEAEGCPTTITLGEVATDPVQHDGLGAAHVEAEADLAGDLGEGVLDRVEAALAERVAAIEAARGVRFVLGERTGSTPARMSAALVEALSGHARRLGMPFRTMASGAGHDTATLAGQGVPSTMIFIRNQNGSHNPDEAMRIEDLCAAATLVAHLVAEA